MNAPDITPLTDDEFQEMTGININELVERRLDDFVEQYTALVDRGDFETAEFLRNEGLHLAEYADGYDPFFFLDQDEMLRTN
jgi:hypothetical protein